MLLHHLSNSSRLLGLAVVLSLLLYLVATLRLTSGWTFARPAGKSHLKPRSDIWNTTLGFQKLFVINMPSRTDRRDAITLSAAVSNLAIEFIDGVSGDSIPEAALPPGGSGESVKLSNGIKGSWRSHMNALQMIVHQNLSTALIFEDDVDWDIRLRQQLETFASASTLLTQGPPIELSKYPVGVSTNPEDPDLSIHNDSSPNLISPTISSLPLSVLPRQNDNSSLYGNPAAWDIIWLGHCGAGFPRPRPPLKTTDNSPNQHNIILTNPNDTTAPLPKYLRAHPFGPLDALASSHPPRTRVYHRASGGVLCTVAYAVSQRGARRLLREFGVKGWSRIWDAEMGGWCAGSDFPALGSSPSDTAAIEAGTESRNAKGERVCVTVQPPIFAHHHPAGGESNIGGVGGGYAREVETKYVRLSVRMNLEALVRGDSEEGMVDQWPD